jgi:hypothetical protein
MKFKNALKYRGNGFLNHEDGTDNLSRNWHSSATVTEIFVSVTPQPLFTPGKDTVPIVQEAGWAPGPV